MLFVKQHNIVGSNQLQAFGLRAYDSMFLFKTYEVLPGACTVRTNDIV